MEKLARLPARHEERAPQEADAGQAARRTAAPAGPAEPATPRWLGPPLELARPIAHTAPQAAP